jgi:uncharacterized protein
MVFITIICAVILGDFLWLVFALRRLPRRWMKVAAGLWGGAQILALAGLIFARGNPDSFYHTLPRWVHSTVLVWHLLGVIPWLLIQVGRGGYRTCRKLVRSEIENSSSDGVSRREFLTAAATFAPPMIATGAGMLGESQLDDFRVRNLTVPIENLPPALDGLTIAHITDLHAGRLTRGKVMERIVEETNRLGADIIATTGDLINDSLRAMPAAMDLIGGLKPKHVLVSCEGNHDLIDNGAEFYRLAEKGGLNLLLGEATSLTIRGQRVQILGLPWSRGAAKMADTTRELLKLRDENAWQLLLAHHPHAWDFAESIPLTLAGHTHGGQLMFNEKLGGGPMVFRYWSGIYRRAKSALVVSNGVGNWFPVRAGAPAEILHITLRKPNT